MAHHTRQPSARSRGLTAWLRMLAFALLAWGLLGVSTASAGPIEDAAAAVDEAVEAAGDVRETRSEEESEYARITASIESIKNDPGIADEYALQSLLRKARAQADVLNALTLEVKRLEGEARRARQALVTAYQAAIAQTEQRLVSTTESNAQAALIVELQALQTELDQARRALDVVAETFEPIDVPDLGSFDSADPEEILAAVDELADNEEQLQAQLSELETRITDLEQRQRIVAYAEDFNDEANLFGEEARSTRVRGTSENGGAQSDEQTTTTAGDPTAPADNGGTVKRGGQDAPPAVTDGLTNEAADPDMDGAEFDGVAAPSSGFSSDDQRIDTPNLAPSTGNGSSDLGGGPAVAPPSTGGGGSTPFIRSDADPDVVAGGSRATGGSYEAELKDLKKRRKRLERSIGDVKSQQERLRERARELGVD